MILKAKNLAKSFYSPHKMSLFANISFEIKCGESIAIVGKSGAGKTTLLHILGTIDHADEGSILINDMPLTKKNMALLRNQHIGFVFQSYNLLEDFTVLENVLMPARIARSSVTTAYGMELLAQVGMGDRAHHKASLLSGGEKQRVAIARALCNDPDLILADEPSGNLDQANTEAIGKLLLDIVKTRNKGLILVTHDPSLASLCQRTYTLYNGRLE